MLWADNATGVMLWKAFRLSASSGYPMPNTDRMKITSEPLINRANSGEPKTLSIQKVVLLHNCFVLPCPIPWPCVVPRMIAGDEREQWG